MHITTLNKWITVDLRKITNSSFWSCMSRNFQRIDLQIRGDKTKVIEEPETLPINMGEDYQLKTHFESGIGVAVDGRLPEQKAMMFKVDPSLERYFLSEIEIIANLSENDLCRTQLEIKLEEDVRHFLNEPCGNHHIITLKSDPALVRDFMKSIE